MKTNLQNKFRILIIGVIVVPLVLCGLILINIFVQNKLYSITFTTLTEILDQQAYNFTKKIKDDILLMSTLSDYLSLGYVNNSEFFANANSFIENSDFHDLLIADKNMQAVSNTGEKVDLSDRKYLQDVFTNKTPIVSAPITSKLRNNINVITLSVPIISNNQVSGAVIGTYSTDKLNDAFFPSFEGTGYVFVTDTAGDIVTETQGPYTLTSESNLFESWKSATFLNNSSLSQVIENINKDESGVVMYNYQGQDRITRYKSLGINDWIIFNAVPYSEIFRTSDQISALMYIVSAIFIIAFLAIIIWIYKIQKKHISTLTKIAYTDQLTGARNLVKFKIDAFDLLKNNPDANYVIIKLDIDGFKIINEMYGFKEGDKLLKNITLALEDVLNKNTDIFARVAADEFAILYRYMDHEDFVTLNDRLYEAHSKRHVTRYNYKLTFPTGRYNIDHGESDIDAIFEKVNYAHRSAKNSDGIKLCDYDKQTKDIDIREKEIENQMEAALKNREFVVYLQPKYDLKTQNIVGAEALVRWIHNGKIISPGAFIPLFERNGFIIKLDMYIYRKACEIINHWISTGKTPVCISVNFSRNHLSNSKFAKSLCNIASAHKTPKEYLEVELTETAIFDNEEKIIAVLKQLHEAGLTLSMDDFGTGYSSLGLLKNIPVDVIKLDKTFFDFANDKERARKIVLGIINLAKSLNIKTVAEGVELKEQIDFLKEVDCDIVQGYYYAKPMPWEQLEL